MRNKFTLRRVGVFIVFFGIVSSQAFGQNSPKQEKTDTIHQSLDSLSLESIEDSIFSLAPRKSHFSGNISYLSNNVYMGRSDSVATPYITPLLAYYHKSGLFINASASYLAVSDFNRIDLVTAEAGYLYVHKSFDAEISAVKYWFNKYSFNVRSSLKESFTFLAGYDLGFIKTTVSPTLSISENADIALTLGLEHSFYLFNDAVDITPTAEMNGSTENFYNSYYKKHKFSVRRKGEVVTVSGHLEGEVLNASQFKILDYEFMVPINYIIKKFTFNFSPVYAIPVNPAITQITSIRPGYPDKTRISNEVITDSFYWQAGLTYKF